MKRDIYLKGFFFFLFKRESFDLATQEVSFLPGLIGSFFLVFSLGLVLDRVLLFLLKPQFLRICSQSQYPVKIFQQKYIFFNNNKKKSKKGSGWTLGIQKNGKQVKHYLQVLQFCKAKLECSTESQHVRGCKGP